ncbi:hypothetical protein [Vibrio parahaemolyticus]|uniref:hypothetical protein n=1 Tax=Vibrio parahaemolyticus TaxID=670 RepID=UPI00235F00D5|nr:hypothetical protein [Vibrio parahaemolyticus]
MSWYQTTGKAVAGTVSMMTVIKAAPAFGSIGTITTGGIVVSAIVGASAALIDKAVNPSSSETPLVSSKTQE